MMRFLLSLAFSLPVWGIEALCLHWSGPEFLLLCFCQGYIAFDIATVVSEL